MLLKFLPIELSWITPAELGPAQPQLVSVILKLNYNSNKWYLHGIAKSLNGKNLGGIGLTLSSSPVGLSWIFGLQYQTLFQSSILKFLFIFTLFIPIPVFLGTLQWTDFLHIYLGGHWETMQNDILPGKYYHMPCLHPQSLSLLPLSGDCRYPPYCSLWRPSSPVIWRLLISFLLQPVETFFPSNLETADILLTAACGDLLPQYLSPGGLFYVNILVKQICDKEERVKKAGKELCILLKENNKRSEWKVW